MSGKAFLRKWHEEEELARQRVGEEFSAEESAFWRLELMACPRNSSLVWLEHRE